MQELQQEALKHIVKVEISYWANPFPLLKDENWNDLPEHIDLSEKFKVIEKSFLILLEKE